MSRNLSSFTADSNKGEGASWIRAGLLLCFLLTFSAAVQPASAQQDATLRVVITSAEDGNPVIGANLIITDPAAGDTLSAGVTNSDGYHQFSNLPAGDVQLAISFIGYETERQILTLEEGESRNYRTVLEVSAEQLDEMVVQAARGAARREAGMQRIAVSDMGRIPTPGPSGDLAMYLQTLPGVVTGGDRGGEFHVRGGTPAQNLVYVDNLPVIKPFHISNLFSAFPQETVESVDMYAGGFGAEYLGATSSVLDVRLRPGNMREYRGSAALSPYLASVHAEGPIQEDRTSFLAMIRHSAIEQTGPLFAREDVPMRFYDMTGRYSVRQDNLSCNVTGINTYDRGQVNPERDLRLTWNNTAFGGRCLAYSERLNYAYDFSMGYTGYQNTEADTDGDAEREAGLHMIYVSLDSERQVLGQSMDLGFRWNVENHYATLDERFTDVESFDDYNTSIHGYIGTEWNLFDRLLLNPSIGTQISQQRIDTPTLEPRFRMSWLPDGTDRQEFSLAVGKYNQMMDGITDERDAGTVFYVWKPVSAGDPLPTTYQGILGYRQQLGRNLEINMEGYAKEHRNIPVSRWTPEAGMTVRTALANGLTYGADIRVELDMHPLYVFLGYDWSQVEYEAASGDLGAWRQGPVFSFHPAHDRRHQFNSVFSYEMGGVTTSVRWELGTGNPYTQLFGHDLALTRLPDEDPMQHPGTAMALFQEPYGARLPAYHRLDVSMDRTFNVSERMGLDLEIGAINSYNRANIFYFDVNTFQRVDQMPLLPYISIAAHFNQ